MDDIKSVVIGRDAAGVERRITDLERRSGLYGLGIQNSGKTTLLKNLIFQDILNGHGVFFLDPHGDAIDDLLANIPEHRAKDVFLLDPTDDTHAFGMNLFSCLNPDSLRERSASYAQAEHIFTKLFANPQTQELDILLSLYLPNAFYPLMANEGYTILEIPLLLREKAFRDRLLERSSIPAETLDFWREEFETLRPDIQREETASTRRRITLFRTHEYVKHIVGQSETTIDFTKIMDNGKILFVKLSGTLAPRVRDLIGTMLVSNLTQAVLRRERVPEADRRHFCVFVDEFQHFASSEDFAVLFTEGRKYKIATTFAHQERFGQFADNRRIAGATLTAAHLVCFRPSPLDAPVLAQVFPKPSPTKTDRERILIISQHPVKDILEGHANPQVQAFATEYLVSLVHRMEDAKAAMERAGMHRQLYQEASGLAQADAQLTREDLSKPRSWSRGVILSTLERAGDYQRRASAQSATLLQLFESTQTLAQVMRSLDSFLTAIMEGRIAKGQDAYVRSLLEIVGVFFPIPQALALYVALEYGDSRTSRSIPFAFARAIRLLSSEATAIEKRLVQEHADQTAREDTAFHTQQQEKFRRGFAAYLSVKDKMKRGRVACVRQELSQWKFDFSGFPVHSYGLYALPHVTTYVPFLANPSAQQVLASYYTARFAPPWREMFPKSTQFLPQIIGHLQNLRDQNVRQRKKAQEYVEQCWTGYKKEPYVVKGHIPFHEYKPIKYAWHSFEICFQEVVLDALQKFLEQYGEGALVTLVLLNTACNPMRWRSMGRPDHKRYVHSNELKAVERFMPDTWQRNDIDYECYTGFNTLYLPRLVGREPLEILLSLERLNEVMAGRNFAADCAKYYWIVEEGQPQAHWYHWLSPPVYLTKINPYDIAQRGTNWWGQPLPKTDILAKNSHQNGLIRSYLEKREDVQYLRKAVDTQSGMSALSRLAERHCGGSSGQKWLVIHYLLARACDLARYGKEIADLTFPQPTLQGATTQEVSGTVSWIAEIVTEMARNEEQQEGAEVTSNLHELQSFWSTQRPPRALVPKIPDYLPSRVLNKNEIDEVKRVCLAQLSGSSVLTVVHDFVRFCDLLARPENHVKVPSNQYTETEVNLYTTQEMVNQVEQELLDLRPPFAYVKSAWKGKIATLAFAPSAHEALVDMRSGAKENAITQGLLKPRSEVEAEIRQRQERWRQGDTGSLPSPPTSGGGSAPPALPTGGSGEESTPSPPTHYTPTKPPKPPGKKSLACRQAGLPVAPLSVRFYESGTWLPEHERRYSDRFSRHSARFVSVVLTMASTLKGGQSKQRVRVKIQYLKPDGDTLAGYEDTLDVRPDTPEPWYHWGIGSANPGLWKPGNYRVVIFIDGVAFAEESFTITTEGSLPESETAVPNSPSIERSVPAQGHSVDFTSDLQPRQQTISEAAHTANASLLPLTKSATALPEPLETQEVETAPPAPELRVSYAQPLEATMSNPHYTSDLGLLDGQWDRTQVMNSQTIIIVTGGDITAELLDRPVAERLRDEIDKRGDIARGRRAIIISDALWFTDATLHGQPVIAVGGPSANALTRKLAHEGVTWQTPEGFAGSFIDGPPPQVTLWGQEAANVRDHVEAWIKHPKNLSNFLTLCWR